MSFVLLALETVLAPFAALGVVLAFLISRRRGVLAGLSSELPERFGLLSDEGRLKLLGREVWWFHAASAGEVGGLAPVFDALWARPDPPAVLVTTATVAGRDAARRNVKVTWAQLAPLDAWPCIASFLSETKPERLILTETELWPSTLVLAARAGLRPVLINARLTERSLPRYRAAAIILRPALDSLSAVLAQSEPDAQRFRSLGVPAARISAPGNTKYDRAAAAADGEAIVRALTRLGWDTAPLFVAGSTHPVEEDLVLDAYTAAVKSRPGLRLVLAPRHVERADEAAVSAAARGLTAARWSALDAAPKDPAVLILDAMGVLNGFWPRATVAFVGGTMVPVGGHNLLEPAQAGVPVLFGPHTRHIEHPAVLLENGGGGVRTVDGAALTSALNDLVCDPARAKGIGAKARELSARLRGATARTLALLEKSA
jgi:3-deoxy-D-manno-octulosonic-acid transferase